MAGTTGKELGASGLSMAAGGIVTEEMHPNLQGRKALETWRTMKDNDALVGSILYAIEMLMRQVEWRVEKGDAKDAEAQFLEECMDDMSQSWGDFISEVVSMLPFGFSFHEITYKRRQGPQKTGGKTPSSKYTDGKIGWRKLPMRAQETLDRWEFGEDGGVQAFVQRAAPDYKDVLIPMEKGLLFRTSSYKNNPEGRSVLRSAYSSWFFKKRIQQIEGVGIERDLAGFPVIWIPAEYLAPDASPEMKQIVKAYESIGANIRRDKQEFLIMPNAYDDKGNKAFNIELLSSGGSRTFNTSEIIARYNKEIAMTVLADFILLGHEGVGSFALSSDKTDLFAVALGTVMQSIADVLNRFAVPRLFELNGMKTTDLPKIVFGDIEKPNLADLGAYLGALTNAGVPLFPDSDLENYLREAGGLPEKSEETKKLQEELKENEDAASGQGGAGDGLEAGGGAAGGDGEPGSGDAVDPDDPSLTGL